MPITTIDKTINDLIPVWQGVECVPEILTADEDAPIIIDSPESRIPYNCDGESENSVIILRGVEECNLTDSVYEITYGSILTKVPIPVVSVVIPSVNDVLLAHAIINVTVQGFTVILSGIPPIEGYNINWSIN